MLIRRSEATFNRSLTTSIILQQAGLLREQERLYCIYPSGGLIEYKHHQNVIFQQTRGSCAQTTE